MTKCTKCRKNEGMSPWGWCEPCIRQGYVDLERESDEIWRKHCESKRMGAHCESNEPQVQCINCERVQYGAQGLYAKAFEGLCLFCRRDEAMKKRDWVKGLIQESFICDHPDPFWKDWRNFPFKLHHQVQNYRMSLFGTSAIKFNFGELLCKK